MTRRFAPRTVPCALALLVPVLLLGACGGTPKYVNPNVDVTDIKVVAVIPFENVSGDRVSSDKVQRIFMTELLSLNVFDVIEAGTTSRAIRNERMDPASLGSDEYKRLGKVLGAHGLFLGTIIDYEEGRSSATSGGRVTIQLRLVDTVSGKTYWATTRTVTGDTVTAKLFGMGAVQGVTLAEQVIREELQLLVR